MVAPWVRILTCDLWMQAPNASLVECLSYSAVFDSSALILYYYNWGRLSCNSRRPRWRRGTCARMLLLQMLLLGWLCTAMSPLALEIPRGEGDLISWSSRNFRMNLRHYRKTSESIALSSDFTSISTVCLAYSVMAASLHAFNSIIIFHWSSLADPSTNK